MATKSQLTVVYVLTTSGQDSYADMALVSALSVRQSNPGLNIVIASDDLSAESLKRAKHRLLRVVDELRVVDAPYESAVHRNRSIKTRLYESFQGPTLNLDADTIVRGSLAPLMATPCGFGAVPNHNGRTPQEQLWSEDAEIISAMGWQAELPCYINTGVIFYRPTPAVREFYSRWHALWAEECEKTGRGRDQPSCYAALYQTQLAYTQLSDQFNFQLNIHRGSPSAACVWHFYSSTPGMGRIYSDLLGAVAVSPLEKLQKMIKIAMIQNDPQRPLWVARLNYFLSSVVGWRILRGCRPTFSKDVLFS